MKGRAIAHLLCVSQAAAELVRDDLTQFLTGGASNVVFVDGPPQAWEERGGWHTSCDIRFETRQDADQLYQRIQQRWSQAPYDTAILAGSTVSLHDCPHDDSVGDCSGPASDYVVAVK